MDMHRTAKEIGLFLTAINLVAVIDSPDVQDKVGASMPLPDSDTEKKVSDIAKWLTGFGKRKYMFLTPEIALIEELLRQTDNKAEVTIAIPCDLDAWCKATPSCCLGSLYMSMKMYPELYVDVDFNKIVTDFYKDVYGLEITAEDIGDMKCDE